ncbi:MAG: hypothetical protein ACXADU_11485 [Promethearchaeota archaeon]
MLLYSLDFKPRNGPNERIRRPTGMPNSAISKQELFLNHTYYAILLNTLRI